MIEDQKTHDDTQEPSMEDILASIRRILSEEGEESEKAVEAPRAAASSKPAEKANVSMARAEPAPSWPKQTEAKHDEGKTKKAASKKIDADAVNDADIGFEEPDPVPMPKMGTVPGLSKNKERDDVLNLTPEMRSGPVMSSPTMAASTDVLAQLAKAVLNQRDVAIGSSDVTIEGMVREMLRPLLKEWLDRNLPYLVERLVKREIDLMVNRAERLED